MSYQEIPSDDQVKFADDMWGVKAFTDACDVQEVPITEWLKATVGAHMPVPHVMSEKVVALKALPPNDWALQ